MKRKKLIRIWGQRTERSGAAKRGGKRPRDTQKAQKDGNTKKKQGRIHGYPSRVRVGRGCAGGQGPYLRSLDYLGRSGEVKKVK